MAAAIARACFCAVAAWAVVGAASAHALRHEVHVGEAVVVALRFTDGEPFAFERYELFRGTSPEPVQAGLTDAQGRLVLLPGTAAQGWRLRAFSADGHGIDTALTFALHDGEASVSGPAAAEPGWERVALGVGLILGVGALAQRLLRRRPA